MKTHARAVVIGGGLLPLFNMSYTVGQLHKYSVDLYKALEAGLERFISFGKGEFRGLEALLRQREEGVPNAFRTLEVNAGDADAGGNARLRA